MQTGKQVFDYEQIPIGYYDEVHSRKRGMQSFWHRKKFENVDSVIEDEVHIQLLDIACGPGTFLGNYRPNTPSVGIDLASGQVKYAQETYGSDSLNFKNISSKQMTAVGTIFDVVTSIEFIEHISESEFTSLLRDIRKTLRDGGQLVITTPNYCGFWPLLEWCIDRFAQGPVYDQQHITHWNRRRLKKVLEVNGFEVSQIIGMHGLAPFLAPLGWRLAEYFSKAEKPFVKRSGFLLLAVATKV